MTYQRPIVAPDIQQQHMTQARFMLVSIIHRAPESRDYWPTFDEVAQSHPKAGGPALRLANAAWDLEYALCFPRSKALKLREEASFARLRDEHRSIPKSRNNFVWQGMELFVPIRLQWIDQDPMALLEKEEIDLPERQDLVRVFWLLKHASGKPYVQAVTKVFAGINPQDAKTVRRMKTIAEAIFAFECRKVDWKAKLSTMKSLLRQDFIRQSKIGDAIGVFQAELDQRLGTI